MSNRKRAATSPTIAGDSDYSLPQIPLDVLIGCFAERDHLQINNNSTTTASSPTIRRNTLPSSAKGLLFNIVDLRLKFEDYLVDNLENKESKVIGQKLQFLDAFCEPMKSKCKQSIMDKNGGSSGSSSTSVFGLCNDYLYELIKGKERDGSVMIQNNAEDFSLLKQFSSIVSEFEELVPVFSSHDYLKSWFLAKQDQLLDSSFVHKITVVPSTKCQAQQNKHQAQVKEEKKSLETPIEEEQEEDTQLSILITMFCSQIQGLFHYFQETNSVYCKKWMKENVAELPLTLFDGLKSSEAKNQKYADRLTCDTKDGICSTILDVDFDMLSHFSQFGSSWKMLSGSKLNKPLSYSLQLNTWSKAYKVMSYHPYSIIQLAKAIFNYDFDHKDDVTYKIGQPKDYCKLDVNNSSKKYSTVVRSIQYQPNPILPKRQTIAVFGSKGKFVGNELVEVILVYRTCNTEGKNPFTAVGGIILQKDDTNRTRIIKMKMYNMGRGKILQNELVVNMMATRFIKEFPSLAERMINQARESGFEIDEKENLSWKGFCDYCREYCKVDPNTLK